MHLRQVVVRETEPQDCASANTQRHLNEWALEDGSQDVQWPRAERDPRPEFRVGRRQRPRLITGAPKTSKNRGSTDTNPTQ